MSIHRSVIAVLALAVSCGPGSRPGNTGDDGGTSCSGDGVRCANEILEQCVNGTFTPVKTCNAPQICAPSLQDCADCDPAAGDTCDGLDVRHCNPDGTRGEVVLTCPNGSCTNGACTDECAQAAQHRSYLGCDYWPVDLDNGVDVLGLDPGPGGPGCVLFNPTAKLVTMPVCFAPGLQDGLCDYGGACPTGTTCQPTAVCALDAMHSPFAIVVSNPHDDGPVQVTLTSATGTTAVVTVPASSVQAIFPQQLGMADQSVDNSGLAATAYHLVSDRPIVAYQFNPLDNVGVFSDDGSLLVPSTAFDVEYLATSYKTLTRRPNRNDLNGFVTVVASAPGTTQVTITTTAGVRAGDLVPALAAGATQTFALTQFQTLDLEAVEDGDLTGTTVTCDKPCGAFGGHEATSLSPNNATCCADHLEEAMFPSSTWGKVYVVALSQRRTTPVPDMIRVVAQKPNTVVTIDPPQAGCTGVLGRGQYCDVFVGADVTVTGSQPISVAHFLTSNSGIDPDAGDPSLAMAVPVEQYRSDYRLLVPSMYTADFMSVIAPVASTVTLDNADISSQLAPIGGGMFEVGRIAVTAGAHHLVCSGGCGVEVYGWSAAVSYMFAGGLDLKQIVLQ